MLSFSGGTAENIPIEPDMFNNSEGKMNYPRVLTIAGSDSCGGAGIQADIKAIQATGSYAASAITAVTVQNTLGVQAVHTVPTDIVRGQIRAVLTDIGADAIKIGMLASAELVLTVRDAIIEQNGQEQNRLEQNGQEQNGIINAVREVMKADFEEDDNWDDEF